MVAHSSMCRLMHSKKVLVVVSAIYCFDAMYVPVEMSTLTYMTTAAAAASAVSAAAAITPHVF
jgi:hypothetical protein